MIGKKLCKIKKVLCRIFPAIISVTLILFVLTASVLAWFAIRRGALAYAPVANPEMLFIGAGHREFDSVNHTFTDDHFEDIRYLYLNGIDVTAGKSYYDYVFCIYGTMVSGYKLQLAFTTNNQFEYEIYRANESSIDSVGAVPYTTHTDTPQTYYYTTNGGALAGAFLNDQTVGGEKIATNARHEITYGEYSNVDKYGEPLYWQTTYAENGYLNGDFINYYILRVKINGKVSNDRETDVICIAVKSFST
ncbi:MAG: hypothetical protein J5662_00505 [Clostridia bacterium]|nr:hypothetical protein [Clostridia bacterium]